MAKLRDFLVPPFALSAIPTAAFRVVLASRSLVASHVLGAVVLLAVLALTPSWVAAGVQRSLPSFEQEVISTVRADDQVLRSIVRSDVVHMVNLFATSQIPTKCTFSNQDVLVHIALPVCVGMSGDAFQNVFLPRLINPALPVGIVLEKHSSSMTFANQQRFALANAVAPAIPSPACERSRKPASAPTNTRRINQTRAPNVCAESVTNLTHSGGFRE